MTIPTKLNIPAKEIPEDLVPPNDGQFEKNYLKEKEAYGADFYESPSHLQEDLDRYSAWKRHRVLTFICMTFLIFWLLLASILGTLVFYRYIARRPVFMGTCMTEVEDDDLSPFSMAQTVEIGPGSQVEKINVPNFGGSGPTTFVHDFFRNITLIKDDDACYLKPLNRSVVAFPTNFIDFIEKLADGYYYQPKAEIINNYNRVNKSPLSNEEMVKLKSKDIQYICTNVPTYWLVNTAPDPSRRRRSLSVGCTKKVVGYIAGKGKVVRETISVC